VRFVEAGLPRNIRSLQRYCAAGRLDCITEETASGLAYFVDPESVERVPQAYCSGRVSIATANDFVSAGLYCERLSTGT
jgi:hypothetical protein